METLKDLIRTLKVGTVLIIEDEFNGSKTASEIVGHYVKVGDIRRKRAELFLANEGFSHIVNGLKKFLDAFLKSYLPDHEAFALQLLPFELKQLLKEIDDRLMPELELLIEMIDTELTGQREGLFRKICLKCGFFERPLPDYGDIIGEVESLEDVHISIFKRIPANTDLNFELLGEGSRFCIAIVDKNVDGDNNAGKQFINETLLPYNNDPAGRLKVLSILVKLGLNYQKI